MDMSSFSYFSIIKYSFSTVGGFLIMLGSNLEPNIGVWIVSLGGSLLYIAIGQDQNLKHIALNLVIGLFFGIFGSQVLHVWESLVPVLASSFFLSIFGVSINQYIIRNLNTTSWIDIISAVVSKIIPWSSYSERNKK